MELRFLDNRQHIHSLTHIQWLISLRIESVAPYTLNCVRCTRFALLFVHIDSFSVSLSPSIYIHLALTFYLFISIRTNPLNMMMTMGLERRRPWNFCTQRTQRILYLVFLFVCAAPVSLSLLLHCECAIYCLFGLCYIESKWSFLFRFLQLWKTHAMDGCMIFRITQIWIKSDSFQWHCQQ